MLVYFGYLLPICYFCTSKDSKWKIIMQNNATICIRFIKTNTTDTQNIKVVLIQFEKREMHVDGNDCRCALLLMK